MLIEILEPLEKPAVLRFTYNDQEWYRTDYPAGGPVKISFGPPKISGVAKVYLKVGDDDEVLVGSCTYTHQDRLGAKMMLDSAKEEKNQIRARAQIRNAIQLLEKLDPRSEDMASAYLAMCFSLFFAKSRKHVATANKQQAVTFYEKALAVWEQNGNISSLSGNLTNISVLYERLGDTKTALERAMRGLELTRHQPDEELAKDEEAVNAWNHAAGRCLSAGRLNSAERIIVDGFKRFGKESPKCAHLWNLRAQVFTSRAQRCRAKAEQLLPPESCPLS